MTPADTATAIMEARVDATLLSVLLSMLMRKEPEPPIVIEVPEGWIPIMENGNLHLVDMREAGITIGEAL